MRTPAIPGVPAGLWEAARRAPRRLLALDYDGTLAPFALDPATAVMPARTRAALARLLGSAQTRVAILSGRPAADVVALLGELRMEVVGEHGWSRLYLDGSLLRHPLPAPLAETLDEAQSEMRRRLAPGRIERKRSSIMVHTRGLAEAAARRVEANAYGLWERRGWDPRLRLTAVDGGVELRIAGRHKGTALDELAGGDFVVAVGDDQTDEDAFLAAQRLGGWSVRVGAPRASVAPARLGSPQEVARFLESWSSFVDGRAPASAEPIARHF